MSISDSMILVFSNLLLSFVVIRAVLSVMKSYQLNKSALKKRKKDETFVQWLLYLKFKEEIPFGWRFLYYFTCLIHLFGILVSILLCAINENVAFRARRLIILGICYFDLVFYTVIYFMFHSRDKHNYSARYAKWIKKKRGMKPKRK